MKIRSVRYAFFLLVFVICYDILIQGSDTRTSQYHENNSKCAKCRTTLEVCSPTLSSWFMQEQEKDPMIHIMEAYRNEKKQNDMLKSGASRVGWGKSAHNYIPCCAIDLCFFVEGKFKQIPSKYKKMKANLPESIENGSDFIGLVDWCHFQIKDWQTFAKNYPYGNSQVTG